VVVAVSRPKHLRRRGRVAITSGVAENALDRRHLGVERTSAPPSHLEGSCALVGNDRGEAKKSAAARVLDPDVR
jgi:hypothetical protein